MQAIQVKFLGPTNTKGSRRKAWCDAGQVTVSTDFALNSEDNARKAAEALRDKLGWNAPHYGAWECGSLPNGDYVFVFSDTASRLAPISLGMLASMRRMVPWLGKLVANGGHLNSVAPQDAVNALAEAEMILAKAKEAGLTP
jgi:hypothetical protein